MIAVKASMWLFSDVKSVTIGFEYAMSLDERGAVVRSLRMCLCMTQIHGGVFFVPNTCSGRLCCVCAIDDASLVHVDVYRMVRVSGSSACP